MAKSILQNEMECLICGTTKNLHCHHVFGGTANRKLSEKYGLKVWLCQFHHTGRGGIHSHKDMDIKLKKYAQEKFEALYGSNTSFRDIFGKNYLEE